MSDSGFEELARNALLDGTDARNVGPLVSETDEGDGVVSLRFESNLPGYLGWKWTVSIAKIGDAEPTVLESELMPGDGALLAPEWVPWSDRLDEYNAARAAAGVESVDEESDDDDEELEDEELEDEELDDEDLLDEDDLVDDDLGDDEYDGVDVDAVLDDEDDVSGDANARDAVEEDDADSAEPESADSESAAVGVDEPEHAEYDARGAGPDESGVVGADEAAEAEEQADERQ
jgi:hypothetical protein